MTDYEEARDRIDAALAQRRSVTKWCVANAVALAAVSVRGHYWLLRYGRHFAEWWPGPARLVFDGRYRREVRAADAEQMRREVAQRWLTGEAAHGSHSAAQ